MGDNRAMVSAAEKFSAIFKERIAYHASRNTIYLNDPSDVLKGIGRFLSGSMFDDAPPLNHELPTPRQLDDYEFVFLQVYLSRLYFDSHYLVIKNYCERQGIHFYIPQIRHTAAAFKNGFLVYEQLRKRLKRNKGRKFILIGMSKGAIDGMAAITHSAETVDFAREHIAGLVSIGGSIGGSHLADLLYGKWAKFLHDPATLKPIAGGLNSMRTPIRKIRNQYFEELCPQEIKRYSISFYNKNAMKSILALPSWYLSRFEEKNDGFVLLKHSKLPGSTDLGNYQGDHSSLLPFFNRHHMELFEALLIYLTTDLFNTTNT